MRPLTEEQEMKYNAASECCICHRKKRTLVQHEDDWQKVSDLDHANGYLIESAHNLCNKRR